MPRGAGRSVGPPCGSRAHHHSSPPRSSQAHPLKRAAVALAPLRLSPPVGAGTLVLPCCRPRAEERLQNNDGEIPIPPWRRACCPAAGEYSGHRDQPFKPAHPGKPPQPIMPPANGIPRFTRSRLRRQVSRRLRRPSLIKGLTFSFLVMTLGTA